MSWTSRPPEIWARFSAHETNYGHAKFEEVSANWRFIIYSSYLRNQISKEILLYARLFLIGDRNALKLILV